MKFSTASYGTWRPGSGSPVAISLGRPRWLPKAADWPQCWELCPRPRYFRAPAAEFDREYLAQLQRYGVERIHAALAEIAATAYEAPSDRLVLCCFEPAQKAEGGCHRRTFAAWWLHETGEPILELA